MKKNSRPTCKKCGIPMKVGIALVNGFRTGPNETLYPSNTEVSYTHCWKCPKCGRSLPLA